MYISIYIYMRIVWSETLVPEPQVQAKPHLWQGRGLHGVCGSLKFGMQHVETHHCYGPSFLVHLHYTVPQIDLNMALAIIVAPTIQTSFLNPRQYREEASEL